MERCREFGQCLLRILMVARTAFLNTTYMMRRSGQRTVSTYFENTVRAERRGVFASLTFVSQIQMRQILSVVSLFTVLACSADSTVEPTPPGTTACGLGPMSIPTNTPAPCSIVPACPRVPPAAAKTLIAVSTCSFGADTGSCNPVPAPHCPFVNEGALRFSLYDPARPGSICVADVHVRIEAGIQNQTRVLWDAQELDTAPNGGCHPVGPEFEGESTIDGPCCQRIVDIPLPLAGRTFRMVVQTDWTGSAGASSTVVVTPASEISVPLSQ